MCPTLQPVIPPPSTLAWRKCKPAPINPRPPTCLLKRRLHELDEHRVAASGSENGGINGVVFGPVADGGFVRELSNLFVSACHVRHNQRVAATRRVHTWCEDLGCAEERREQFRSDAMNRFRLAVLSSVRGWMAAGGTRMTSWGNKRTGQYIEAHRLRRASRGCHRLLRRWA